MHQRERDQQQERVPADEMPTHRPLVSAAAAGLVASPQQRDRDRPGERQKQQSRGSARHRCEETQRNEYADGELDAGQNARERPRGSLGKEVVRVYATKEISSSRPQFGRRGDDENRADEESR